MRPLSFTKMHGTGNDYIYLDFLTGSPAPGLTPDDIPALCPVLSPRHTSVGSDGMVGICPSDDPRADALMRMFNTDGSESAMCGNAIRCVGKFLYDRGIVKKEHMVIETLSGLKTLTLTVENGICTRVAVDMGYAATEPERVPVLGFDAPVVGRICRIGGYLCRATAVSMGNPHCVLFTNDNGFLPDDPAEIDLETIGPRIENDPQFPGRVNAEFVRVIGKNALEMRVWERGSGETYACGTGTCASAAAAVLCGYCKPGEPVLVHLRGGDLTITVGENLRVTMEGGAVTVYDGTFYLE